MKCFTCGFWNGDYVACTCPSTDKWYACPIESQKAENIKALKEIYKPKLEADTVIIDEFAFRNKE